jgi:hypothetical protein
VELTVDSDLNLACMRPKSINQKQTDIDQIRKQSTKAIRGRDLTSDLPMARGAVTNRRCEMETVVTGWEKCLEEDGCGEGLSGRFI